MQFWNFAHNVLSQKTMFKVSNRNTKKRCLLISKITLKTSEWRHLTTSYLREVTVQNHVLLEQIFQFEIKSLLSVMLSSLTACNFNKSRPIYVILWEMRNHFQNIWFMKIQNISIFLFLKKQPQKRTNFSTFYLIFKGPPFQYHKVRHPNFLQYTTFWNGFLKFELRKDSFFINILTKVSWKTL